MSRGAVRGAGARAAGGSASVGRAGSVTPSPGTACPAQRGAGGQGVGRPASVTRRAPRSAHTWTEDASVRETSLEISVTFIVLSVMTRSSDV